MLISQEWQSAKTLLSLVMRHRKRPVLIYFLLGFDLVLIIGHCLQASTDYLSLRFALSQDRGYPELVQWAQIWITAILLWGLSFRRQSHLYSSWAVAFVLLLINDITLIHERGGLFLAQRLSLPSGLGLQASDYGELMIYGVAGIGIALLVWWGHHRNQDVIARPVTTCLLTCVVSLLIASEIFDVLRIGLEMLLQVSLPALLQEGFVVIEEGSELMISSVSLWLVWRLWITFAPLPRGVAPKPGN